MKVWPPSQTPVGTSSTNITISAGPQRKTRAKHLRGFSVEVHGDLAVLVSGKKSFKKNFHKNRGGRGYSYMQLSGSIAEQLKDELAYTFGRILDIEVIELDDTDHFAVAFAAVLMRTEGRPIEAVVCLLKRYPDHSASECLLKEVHESEGPTACFCSTRILERLTPTQDLVSLSWRERCRTLCDWEDERWAEQMLADLPN